MKSHEAKEELIEILQRKIAQIKDLRERRTVIQKEVETEMFERFRVGYDITVYIFNGEVRVETLSYSMLYRLMEAIRSVLIKNDNVIDTSELVSADFFFDHEISEYSKAEVKNNDDFDIVIESGRWFVTDVFPHYYITIHTTVDEVSKWRDHNKFRFNPETQRDLITIESKGVGIKKLDLNEKALKEIYKRLSNNSYFPVPLIGNINPEHNEESVEFSGKDLVISQNIKIDLIEGFHNFLSLMAVKDSNPGWTFPCEVKLYFLNTSDANRYIEQMDNKNHFKSEQKARINLNNDYNYIIRTLNSSQDFIFRGSIDSELFLYLTNVLEKIYKIEDNNKEKVLLPKKIEEGLNKIIISFDLFDSKFSKEDWFCYLFLVKASLIDNHTGFDKILKDKERLQKTINSIKIVKNPTTKHFKMMNDYIEEVNRYV